MLYSPTGSATTGYSGGSSLDLQYKGAWCTPPRVFVDYQEEVAPQLEPGMVPSTVDPGAERGGGNKAPKKPVRISAWKLAKLDSSEAVRAAAKARASSSVLRPIDNHHHRLPDVELSSSGNMSVRSSMSTDMVGANKEYITNEQLRLSPLRNSFTASQGSRDEYEVGTQSVSSFSSPSHVHEPVTLSPLPPATHGVSQINNPAAVSSIPGFFRFGTLASKSTTSSINNPMSQTATLGFDERIMQKVTSTTDPLLLSAPATSLLPDVKRTSVVWDQEAGRYVSIPVSASAAWNRPSSSLQIGLPNPNRNTGSGNFDKKPADLPQEPSAKKPPVHHSENLTYTGESIFFGGPLFSVPLMDKPRNEMGSSGSQDRFPLNMPRESRFKRDAASNQLPVFIPGGFEQNPPSGSGLK